MKSIRIFLLLILPLAVNAQQYDYASLIGGVAGKSYAQAVTSDLAGNVYVKGSYTGGQQVGATLHRTPGFDAFLAKFDASGALVWYKDIGFTESEDGTEYGNLTIDPANNIYIIGSFKADATIEGTLLTNSDINKLTNDVYVIKYDQNGNFQWATSFGGTDDDLGAAITVDATENVYVGGSTKSSSFVFAGTSFTPGGSPMSSYWARINADGSHGWIKFDQATQYGVTTMDFNDAVSSLFIAGETNNLPFYRSIAPATGLTTWTQSLNIGINMGIVYGLKSFGPDIYITGYFDGGGIEFPSSSAPIVLPYVGGKDIFLAKIETTAGNTTWASGFGGSGNEVGTAVDIKTSGEVFFTGSYFSSDLTLSGAAPLPAPGVSGSPYFAKADDSGAITLSTNIPTSVFGKATGINVNLATSSVLCTGNYIEEAFFGSQRVNQKSTSYYLGSYKSTTLANQWVISPAKGQINAQHMAVDPNDNLFITGEYDGTISIQGHTIVSSEIKVTPSSFKTDLFVAKFSPNGNLDWLVSAGGLGKDEVNDITTDAGMNGSNVYVSTVISNTPTIAGNLLTATDVGSVIIKLSPTGTLTYALPIDLPFTSQITSIQGDNSMVNEGLYIAGFYDDPTGTETIYGNTVPASVAEDMFILKLDYDGTQINLKYFGGDGEDRIVDMAKLPGSELHIAGTSNSSSLILDATTITIPPANEADIFVATLDFSLTTLTAFNDGGPGFQICDRMDLNSSGDIALFGLMETTGDFSGTVLNKAPSEPGYFIATYQSTGTIISANEIIVSLDPVSSFTDLAIDDLGNTYISGLYFDPIDFGNGTLTTNGDGDGFFVSYDNTGTINFTKLIGGDYSIGAEAFYGFDGCYSLGINSLNEVWVTGTLAVKPITLGTFTLQPASSEYPGYVEGQDTYLIKITPDGVIPNALQPKVYWSDLSEINRSNLDGTAFARYHDEIDTQPIGVAIDTINNIIYWTNDQGIIRKGEIDASGLINVTDFINDGAATPRNMQGLTLDVAAGKIYWASTYDNSIKSADLFDPNPISTVQTITTVTGNPIGIAVDPANAILYYTVNDNQGGLIDNIATLHQIGITGTNDIVLKTTQVSGIDYLYNDVKLDLANNFIYWTGANPDEFAFQGEIYIGNLLDVGSATSFTTINNYPTGIDLDLKNGKIYWIDGPRYITDPVIAMANLDGTNQTVIQPGFPNISSPKFIALDTSLPVVGCPNPPTVNAGVDQTVCNGSPVSLSATLGGGATSITWTTSGDGTFDDITSLTAIYTPGTTDLNITGITNGDGAFDNYTNQTAIFTPGAANANTASVILTITTNDPDGTGPCIAAADNIEIIFEELQTVDAGADQSVCPGDVITLNGSFGGSATSILWSGNGDGSFNDATSVSAIYTPGTSDKVNGLVSLFITSNPGICGAAEDTVDITLNLPIVVVDQSTSLDVEETVTIDVTNGATFNTGDVLTTTILTPPLKGSATINASGNIDYSAPTGTVGADSLIFEVRNQCGQSSSAQANITINNQPPAVNVPPSDVISGGIVTINILSNIFDNNGNVDLSSLKIIVQPMSGASATLDATGNLTIDYDGITFVGMDELTIEICDFDGLCAQQIIYIDVAPPTVIIYNALSPNGDGKHDYLEIENMEFFPANKVRILNRWGDVVFEINGYDNLDNRFNGNSNKGGNGELPPGTYFYSIILGDGSAEINGFIDLRR